MTDLDLYDGIRLITVLEALAVIALNHVQARLIGGSWRTLDAINRFRLSGGVLLSIATIYGCVEAILDGTPGSLRVILYAIAFGYLALSYAMTIREERRLAVHRRLDEVTSSSATHTH